MSPFGVLHLLFLFLCALLTLGVEGAVMNPFKRFDHTQNMKGTTADFSGYTLPLSNGVQSLPPPNAGLTLKCIALARGVWNYTCATSTSASIPQSIGAIATLFDASPLIPYITETQFHQLPPVLVQIPLSAIQNTKLDNIGHLSFSGPHTPIFDLSPKAYFIAILTASIPAPVGAAKGADGGAAVPWYQLMAQPGSYGVSELYRIETAGGSAPATCEGQPALVQRQYSAETWMYG